jgi:hypothetical protein
MADDLGWFAGVDWASETHQVTVLDALGTVIGEHAFLHGGAGNDGRLRSCVTSTNDRVQRT